MPDRIKHNPTDMQATDGPLDELVITGCDIHLEQMSERSFVMVITRGSEEMRVSIYAPGRGRVHARADVDAGFKAIAKGEGAAMTALTQDAEKFNAPRHFGREIMRGEDPHEDEILPRGKPKLRRVKALVAKGEG